MQLNQTPITITSRKKSTENRIHPTCTIDTVASHVVDRAVVVCPDGSYDAVRSPITYPGGDKLMLERTDSIVGH